MVPDVTETTPSPLQSLVRGLLQPVASAANSPVHATHLLRELGYRPPSDAPGFAALSAVIGGVDAVVTRLSSATESEDETAIALAVGELLIEVGRFASALSSLAPTVEQAYAGSNFLAATNLLAELPRRLVDYVIVRYFEAEHPTALAGLQLLGLVSVEDITTPPTVFHCPYTKREIHWDRIAATFGDPKTALTNVLWNGNSFRYLPFLALLDRLATSLGLPSGYAAPQPQILQVLNDGVDLSVRPDYLHLVTFYFPLYRDPAATVGFELHPVVNVGSGNVEGVAASVKLGLQLAFPVSEFYQLKLKVSADAADAFGVRLQRGAPMALVSGLSGATPATLANAIRFGATLALEPSSAPIAPMFRFGVGGSAVQIGSGALRLGIERQESERLFIEAELRDGQLTLGAGDADGFLATLLPNGCIRTSFGLGFGVATDRGLYFIGSSCLEIQLPVHVQLGPIEVLGLRVAVKPGTNTLPMEVGGSFCANLGPLRAVVENVGLRLDLRFPPTGGNLGPFDLTVGFKPPTGVGLQIDASVVKGGGYLFFDVDREEYAGAIELTINDFLSLKAIGLITTRMPDGSKGFSLLVIITAEFSPGLQIGYGFTLIGVGGLLGLNRTVVIDALALGVRTGAVNGIMFPVDPVANAPRIISDLRTIFPPTQDVFLIGPMAKLGWGTPTLVSLALGVIIEIPGNVAILGVLKVVLPNEDAALIKLQVNFVGTIEFDKKRGWFFAALFESRLLFITLEGEMGALIAIGDDANFVLSVGGFHPRFSPPPLPFPSPHRISFDIVNKPTYRIRVEGYFAVTTNTAQFGARAELYFGFSAFSVEGHLAFDALMRFSPFYFIVEISAGVSLKAFGVGVLSIDLEFTLEGTTPWHARGRGSISLLFFSISADFDETWGESRDTTLPPIQIVPLITAEVQNIANWRTLPPVGSNLLVSLRKLDLPTNTLVLHPLGTLEVSQRAMPLDTQLDRVGAQKPSDANRVVLKVKSGGLAKKRDATNSFAPAQFKDMNDAQKLSAHAFETMPSGLQLGVDDNEWATGTEVKRVVRYEVTTIDTNYRRFVRRFRNFAGSLFEHFLKGNAAALSSLSSKRKHDLQPFADKVKFQGDTFVVARASDNRVFTANSTFASEASALDYLQQVAANDPNLGLSLHVIPTSEVNAA